MDPFAIKILKDGQNFYYWFDGQALTPITEIEFMAAGVPKNIYMCSFVDPLVDSDYRNATSIWSNLVITDLSKKYIIIHAKMSYKKPGSFKLSQESWSLDIGFEAPRTELLEEWEAEINFTNPDIRYMLRENGDIPCPIAFKGSVLERVPNAMLENWAQALRFIDSGESFRSCLAYLDKYPGVLSFINELFFFLSVHKLIPTSIHESDNYYGLLDLTTLKPFHEIAGVSMEFCRMNLDFGPDNLIALGVLFPDNYKLLDKLMYVFMSKHMDERFIIIKDFVGIYTEYGKDLGLSPLRLAKYMVKATVSDRVFSISQYYQYVLEANKKYPETKDKFKLYPKNTFAEMTLLESFLKYSKPFSDLSFECADFTLSSISCYQDVFYVIEKLHMYPSNILAIVRDPVTNKRIGAVTDHVFDGEHHLCVFGAQNLDEDKIKEMAAKYFC